MEWNLVYSATTIILVINGNEKGTVKGLKALRDSLLYLKVRIEDTCLKLNFNDCTEVNKGTRTAFIEKWSSLVHNSLEVESTCDSFQSEDSFIDSGDQSEVECLEVQVPISGNGACDQEIKERYLGIYDVHVSNLTPPNEARLTRVLDMAHVTELAASFGARGLSQIVILMGMVSANCNLSSLKTKGCARVETLGGNHSREALQNLVSRGIIDSTATVKVHLYEPLSRCAALMLGWQHNTTVEERQKSLTYMDKVRLMRQVRPVVMDKQGLQLWKATIAAIFRVQSTRRLQASYHTHLKMANFNNDLYTLLEAAAATLNLTERLFRGLIKLKDETKIASCLQCLIDEGLTAFRNKIKQKDEDTPHEDEPLTANNNAEECFLEKYNALLAKFKVVEEERNQLQKENVRMKEEINTLKKTEEPEEELQSRKKQKIGHEEGHFLVGEKVEAFWQYESGKTEWLPATVLKIYKSGEINVMYEDGACKVKNAWVKRFGQP